MARQMIDIGLTPVIVDGEQVGEDLTVSVGGDFVMVESSDVHGEELIYNNKGDFKQNPTICVGAENYLDGEGFNDLLNAISAELQRDGVDVQKVALDNSGELDVTGYYK